MSDIFSDAIGAVTAQLSGLWPQPEVSPQLVNGKLRPCPPTPNCVSSESSDLVHRIDPLPFSGSPEEAMARLKKVVKEKGGTVQHEEHWYIWSIFTVPVFGFIDDVEFRLSPEERVIHLRSSSRLGFSDLGVNRARVEELRKAFQR
ncbi:DUF1499 domain-containing protein [Chlorobium sp. BLA1]|uniref:DUF1499 domain-containing protein n=1 Tax=Candidatus Chlorobium masyuteum TaxID=2716876 RepID=UPI001421CF14|nr:DUF1499 domain-containing protein [Candidatus Chlorobium masyuteum]NHQ59294.1 DUF1499 domain-containing protein [Candidatus Chlorobium masyuteum]NTU45069.1 DUF1499 domain-containing protein [Chlorobiaceae bacterium]